jgi:hypothetical protein
MCSLCVVLSAAFYFAFSWSFFPIYPDEISQLFAASRQWIDGPVWKSHLTGCYVQEITIPNSLLFAAFLSNFQSLILSEHSIRAFPMLQFAVFALVTAFAFAKYTKISTIKVALIYSFLTCYILSGPQAFSAVISRPEGLILVFFGIIGLVALANDRPKLKLFWLMVLLIWFSVVNYAHSKGAYLVPFVVGAVYFARTKPKYATILYGLTLWVTYESIKFNLNRYIDCNGNPHFEAWVSAFNVNPMSLFSDPALYFSSMSEYPGWLKHNFMRFLRGFTYHKQYDIGILPPVSSSVFREAYNIGSASFATLVFAGIVTAPLYLLPFALKKELQNIERYALAVIAFVFVNMVHNRTFNLYDLSVWLVLFTFAIPFLVFSLINNNRVAEFRLRCSVSLTLRRINKFIKILTVNILILWMGSSVIVNKYGFFQVFQEWRNVHWAGPNTPSRYLSEGLVTEIKKFADKQCSLDNYEKIFFDDHTYAALARRENVFPITYFLLSTQYGRSPEVGLAEQKKWLASNPKTGFLGSCDFSLTSRFGINSFKVLERENICCYSLN